MEKIFLLVERMVLESLARSEKTLDAIIEDTQLDPGVVGNILAAFLERNYVLCVGEHYRLNPQYLQEWKVQLAQTEVRKEEVREMLTSLANEYFKVLQADGRESSHLPAMLKIRKVWADESEALMLASMLSRLEKFIRDLETRNKKNNNRCRLLSKKQVIFWGQADYGALAQESLEVI